MAQIKSQMKRIGTNEKSRVANVARRSAMRTAIKTVNAEVAAGDQVKANADLKAAVALIDHAQQDGIIKMNNAARKKAALMSSVATMKKAN